MGSLVRGRIVSASRRLDHCKSYAHETARASGSALGGLDDVKVPVHGFPAVERRRADLS